MDNSLTQVFFPGTFQDLFSTWSRLDSGEESKKPLLYAGGIEFNREQGKRTITVPENIISLERMRELHKITRSERYLEIGAMVKLNQIIHLGKIVPEALHRCLLDIADPQIRNLATIGGNICNPKRRLGASAPMIALDAQYELRTAQSSRWISASRFSSVHGPLALEPQEILTRIRVPLEPWTFTWYRKFRTPGSNELGGGILFIVKIQKNILSDIRVIYSGRMVLRERSAETMLAGKLLPLDKKETKAFVEKWKAYLSGFDGMEIAVFPGENGFFHPELAKSQILNFIDATLMHISD